MLGHRLGLQPGQHRRQQQRNRNMDDQRMRAFHFVRLLYSNLTLTALDVSAIVGVFVRAEWDGSRLVWSVGAMCPTRQSLEINHAASV